MPIQRTYKDGILVAEFDGRSLVEARGEAMDRVQQAALDASLTPAETLARVQLAESKASAAMTNAECDTVRF
jgi:hypothetical protein